MNDVASSTPALWTVLPGWGAANSISCSVEDIIHDLSIDSSLKKDAQFPTEVTTTGRSDNKHEVRQSSLLAGDFEQHVDQKEWCHNIYVKADNQQLVNDATSWSFHLGKKNLIMPLLTLKMWKHTNVRKAEKVQCSEYKDMYHLSSVLQIACLVAARPDDGFVLSRACISHHWARVRRVPTEAPCNTECHCL